MLLLRRPTNAAAREYLARQGRLDFTYEAVGATATTPPEGFLVDQNRTALGRGAATFRAAKAALKRWEQFRMPWLESWPPDAPIRVGEVTASLAHVFGMWFLSPCRIVYVIDEPRRFGFANGTLPGHAETGEERFLIEWEEDTDEVVYDILAFSQAQHPLVRLSYPWMRLVQKRFARGSAAAMRRAVAIGLERPGDAGL